MMAKKAVNFQDENRYSQATSDFNGRSNLKKSRYSTQDEVTGNAESGDYGEEDETVIQKKRRMPDVLPDITKQLNKPKRINGLFRDGGKGAKRETVAAGGDMGEDSLTRGHNKLAQRVGIINKLKIDPKEFFNTGAEHQKVIIAR